MPYVQTPKTERLQLPSDSQYWVELKLKASYGDRLAAQEAMLEISSVDLMTVDPKKAAQVDADPDSGRGVLTEFHMAAFFKAMVLRLIVAWNLTDEQDEPLPISAESLELLENEDGEFLQRMAQMRTRTMRSADGPFERRSPAPSSVTPLPTLVSPEP